MAFIRKVTKDVSEFTAKLKLLQTKKTQRAIALEARKKMLEERRRLKADVARLRDALAVTLTKNLRATVTDYTVLIRFHEGKLSSEYEEFLKTTLGLRTSNVPRARLIASNVTPVALAKAASEDRYSILQGIKDEKGLQVFNTNEAKSYLQILKEPKHLYSLEICDFQDRPEITITKEVPRPDGTKHFVKKDFSKLSLGQQQAILLSIMLFSKSNAPLIIDQPEDNLDSEFIYKTFVKTLRVVKERRQVIVVTHNANIAVLGDAELILPLKSTNDQAIIVDRGSIDSAATKSITCAILEGSDRAFKRRKAVYGFD